MDLALSADRRASGPIASSVLGNSKARVTLVEYGAPSCPVCARFDASVFPRIKQKYIDTGKVRFVFRVFPLREADGEAEKLARCLPSKQYFPFIETLFIHQPDWDPEFGVTKFHDALLGLAEGAGLEAQRAATCVDDKSADAGINATATEAESRYDVKGTPTFVINGHPQTSGFRTFEQLSDALDAELAKSPRRP